MNCEDSQLYSLMSLDQDCHWLLFDPIDIMNNTNNFESLSMKLFPEQLRRWEEKIEFSNILVFAVCKLTNSPDSTEYLKFHLICFESDLKSFKSSCTKCDFNSLNGEMSNWVWSLSLDSIVCLFSEIFIKLWMVCRPWSWKLSTFNEKVLCWNFCTCKNIRENRLHISEAFSHHSQLCSHSQVSRLRKKYFESSNRWKKKFSTRLSIVMNKLLKNFPPFSYCFNDGAAKRL